jgi:hypothetical protein
MMMMMMMMTNEKHTIMFLSTSPKISMILLRKWVLKFFIFLLIPKILIKLGISGLLSKTELGEISPT